MSATIPRSPYVTGLLQRTASLAPYLPSDDRAANDHFPPPAFIEDVELGEMILLDLAGLPRPAVQRLRRGAAPLTFTGALLYLGFVAFIIAGLGAMLVGLCAGLEALSAMGAGR